jgi:hypothetical protein
MRYLGQNLAMNTIQFEYSFTPRWGAHLGYRYTKRKIYAFNAVNYLAEIFDPGGSAGATDAARGDCSLPAGETLPANAADLPAGCTLNSDGSVTFSGLTPASDTAHNVDADINGHSALFGIWGRPTDKLRTNFDMELFSADASFTRITPRQLQRYSVQASYLPIHWAEVSGSVNIVESRDNVVEVQNKEHNRNFTGNVTLSPSDTYSFDLGYDYSDIYTQALVCYALGFGPPPAGQVCPIAGSPVAAGSLSTYADKSHFLNSDINWQPAKKLALRFGYSGSFSRGTPLFIGLNASGFPDGVPVGNFLNPLTPFGPLRFNYQQPYANMSYSMSKDISYNVAWNYYGYYSRGNQNPTGLAPLGGQDFTGNTLMFSLRYSH